MLKEQVFSDEGVHGHGSIFKGGENLMPGIGSEDSGDSEVEVEVEISTPRLCTTEFNALRQKFPVAFRRRTSLASVCSGASSIYSGSMIIGEVRHAHRRSRTEGSRSLLDHPGGSDGLPPRPPPKQNKTLLAKTPKRIVNDENGCREMDTVKGSEEHDKNSEQKVSLKERLRRNREEMKVLLAKDNLPFKHKPRETDAEIKHSNILPRSPKVANTLANTFHDLQTPSIPLSPRRQSPRTHGGHTLLEHLKTGKHASAKRLKGPSGDIDSASVSSTDLSLTPRVTGHSDGLCDRHDRILASECGAEEVIEPISNARAPKLKSARRRGKSPCPIPSENVSPVYPQQQSAATEWPPPLQSPRVLFADDDQDSVRSAPQARSVPGRAERCVTQIPPRVPRGRSASVDGRQGERVTFEDEVDHRQYQRSSSYTNLKESQLHTPDSDFGPVKPVHKRFHSSQDIQSNSRKGPVKLRKHHVDTAAHKAELSSAAVSVAVSEQNSTHHVHRVDSVVTKPPKSAKLPWRWRSSKKKEKPQALTESLLSTIPPPIAQGRSNTQEMDTASEILFRDFADDIEFEVPKEKKSKLRWKRNKGRYTPNEEFERRKLNILQSNSRSSSLGSLNSMGSNYSVSSNVSEKKKKDRSSSFDHTRAKSLRKSIFR